MNFQESSPNEYADSRMARIIYIIIFATWVGYLFTIILGFFFQDYALIGLTLVGSILLIFPIVMLRQRKLQISSLSLIVIELSTLTFIATVGQGIRDLALLGFPIILFSLVWSWIKCFSAYHLV